MILYCGCVAAKSIPVHSGNSTTGNINPKPRVVLSFAERTRGAEYQDKHYGEGNRVHNLLRRKPSEAARARCSICESVKSV